MATSNENEAPLPFGAWMRVWPLSVNLDSRAT